MNEQHRFFTEEVKEVIAVAQNEAQILNYNFLESEHILIGILSVEHSAAYSQLALHNLNLQKAQRAMILTKQSLLETTGEDLTTPKTRNIIHFAIEEFHRLNHDHLGTEHLLLGILRENLSIGWSILEPYVKNRDSFRGEILEQLRLGGTSDLSAVNQRATQQSQLHSFLNSLSDKELSMLPAIFEQVIRERSQP